MTGVCLVAAVLAVLAAPAAGLDVWFSQPDGTAWGVFCSSTGVGCVSVAHTVVMARPASPLNPLFGASSAQLGGGGWTAGPPVVSESHLVSDNTTQVFTVNWAWHDAADNGRLPLGQTLCLDVQMADWATGERGGASTCMDFSPNVTTVGPNPTTAVTTVTSTPSPSTTATSTLEGSLLFGNWTVACGASLGRCRVLGHVAVSAVAAPGPTTPLAGGGEVSYDSGVTWRPAGQLTWLAYFDGVDYPATTSDDIRPAGAREEQHEEQADDAAVSQRWHYTVDEWLDYDPTDPSTVPAWSEVCYRVWLTDVTAPTASERVVWINVSDDTSITRYSGYARNATVRCWPLASILLLP